MSRYSRQDRVLRATLTAAVLGVAALLPAGPARPEPGPGALEWRGAKTTVEAQPLAGGLYRYAFRAVDANGGVRERAVSESVDASRLRTGNALFDGLYALALTEAAEDSVNEIKDAQFNDGRPIPCHCFETGAKWPYVWTRDISYSVDLALALLDAPRARDSLFFKQSPLRPALVAAGMPDAHVVAQDTGSGGSWPVSTDRVVWIHAASDVIAALGADGEALRPEVLRIAADTLAQDRRFAFDARSGLYRGETSFLDWREQTYPAWTRADTRYIAEGFSLSTNVLHYVALVDAAQLARRARSADTGRLAAEAVALRTAINTLFWVPAEGLYASYLSRDLAPAHAYDLLGIALAIVHGVADPGRARLMLARYPVTPAGPPVIWPEQPDIAIYHNRALWPFVTAYALRAAARARDPSHMTAYAESIVRGAALSLSNYENHEFLTQRTVFADGALSGPVINSPRQLWSVAAYVGMVVSDLFGIHVGADGELHLAPSVPGGLAHHLFGAGRELRLEQARAGGRRLDVALELPATWSDSDVLQAAAISVDGRALDPRQPLPSDASHVRIRLRAAGGAPATLRVVDARDPSRLTTGEQRALFAPPSPVLAVTNDAAAPASLSASGVVAGNRWQLYRDGVEVGSAAKDAAVVIAPDRTRAECYTATQAWPDGGHRSLPSREICIAGVARTYLAGATLRSPDGASSVSEDGVSAYRDWGTAEQRLEFVDVAPADGLQRVVLRYANGYGPVNTGVTAAVKEVTAQCPSESLPQRGTIVMPHLGSATLTDVSTAFVYRAKHGERCRLVVADGLNMSYLEHFALYTAGPGGRTGPWNRAHVYGATVVSTGGGGRQRVARAPLPPG
jgi:hypothetical protein